MSTIASKKEHVNEVPGEKKGNKILPIKEETVNNAPTPEYPSNYLEGWALGHLAFALMVSAFVLSLDNTILATATPRITSEFNSLNDIGWYASSYKITQMALLPTCGRIYTFYDIRWSYIILLLIFELGSIVCAIAKNSTTLIVGRAVSGVGAAGLMSGATIIISYCMPLRKRPILLGLLSLVFGLGSVLGPLVGGAITDNERLGWRFCFWVNLPFGAVGLAQIWFALSPPPPAVKAGLLFKEKLRQLDFPGATILIGSVVCLSLALQWGGIIHPWSSPKVYGCFIGFGVLLLIFLYMQFKFPDNCTVPLHLFRNRTLCSGCGFIMFLFLTITVQTYYWPIYFQSVKDTTAKDSGIFMFPFAISSMLSTFATGWIVTQVGYYVPFMWIGAPILAAGGALFKLLDAYSPAARWAGFQILSGVGFGICGQIPFIAVQVVLEKEDVPTGCVLVIFFECLGASLGPSVGQNIFTDTLSRKLGGIKGVDARAVVDAGAKDFRRLVLAELLGSVVRVFEDALWNVFLLTAVSAVVAFVFSLGMQWRRLPPKESKKRESGGEPIQAEG